MPLRLEIIHHDFAAAIVIDKHRIIGQGGEPLVQRHYRHRALADDFRQLRRRDMPRINHHASALHAYQKVDGVHLLFRALLAVSENQAMIVRFAKLRRVINQRREKGTVINRIGHHQANHAAFFRRQLLRQQIRPVARLLNGFVHQRFYLFPDDIFSIQHARHRGFGNAGTARHVKHCHHYSLALRQLCKKLSQRERLKRRHYIAKRSGRRKVMPCAAPRFSRLVLPSRMMRQKGSARPLRRAGNI